MSANSTSAHCRNCEAPLQENAVFCSQCGQKNTTGKVTVMQLFSEFFENIFNLDSRIFRTLAALPVPGKLTIEYFQGKHKSYYMPVRLFVLTSLALLAVITFQDDDKQVITGLDQLSQGVTDLAAKQRWLTQLDTLRQDIHKDFQQPEAGAAVDSFYLKIEQSISDSLVVPMIGYERSALDGSDEVKVAAKDFTLLSAKELTKKYKVSGIFHRLQFRQMVKMIKDGDSFSKFFMSKTFWSAVFMMPLVALVLMLFYFGSGRYYVEHLVFSLHVHAFAFSLLAVAYFLESVTVGWLSEFALLFVLGYAIVALKRVYLQSWGMTVLKFVFINLLYIAIFFGTLMLTIVISFFLF